MAYPAKSRRARIVALALAIVAITPGSAEPNQPPQPTAAAAGPRLGDLPPAVIDNTLMIGGEDIAARKSATRMTVAVRLEGRGPFRFVVDSGADTSVVGVRAARALQLTPTTPVLLHGMTATSQVDRVQVGELGLGQSIIRDLQLPVLKEEDLGGQGMIGIDALHAQRLMMDFDKKVITIEDTRKPAPRMDGEIVVIARRRRGQLILTQASVDRRGVDG